MRTFVKAGAVGVFIAALTGCGLELSTENEEATVERVDSLVTPNDLAPLSLCRWMEFQLRKREANVYQVKTYDDLVAVSVDGQILCIDEPPFVIRAGVIPVEKDDARPCARPGICDGTPLPADRVMEMAREMTRKYGEQSAEF